MYWTSGSWTLGPWGAGPWTLGSLRVLHPRVHPIIISSVCPAECVLGPTGEEEKEQQEVKLQHSAPCPAQSVLQLAHGNAFHVWDTDNMVISLPAADDSAPCSPLIHGAMPYMPSFFPGHGHSPPHHYTGLASPPSPTSPQPIRDHRI